MLRKGGRYRCVSGLSEDGLGLEIALGAFLPVSRRRETGFVQNSGVLGMALECNEKIKNLMGVIPKIGSTFKLQQQLKEASAYGSLPPSVHGLANVGLASARHHPTNPRGKS